MKKQTSICYVIPYFGKLPAGFKMWLLSCSANDTIDWILYTDDYTEYDYPNNVKVHYCSYEDIKKNAMISKCQLNDLGSCVNLNQPMVKFLQMT